MTEAIMQAVIKAATKAVMEAETPASTIIQALAMPKTGCPMLKQPMFDWKSPDKYIKLCNFEIRQ